MANGPNKTFCPQVRVDNHCYCSTENKLRHPTYCDVECVKFHVGPNEHEKLAFGGCQCRDFLAGAHCERTLCHYAPSRFYNEQYYQLFCLDGFDFNNPNSTYQKIHVDEECHDVPNLHNRSAASFPLCPCLNGGHRLEESKTGDFACQCPRGYTGSLCQMEPPPFHRPSPGPTVGVITFLAAVFVVIGLALWYRKRKEMKMYAKMYQLDPIKSHTDGVTKRVFAPLKLPIRSAQVDASSPTDSGTPGSSKSVSRRQTLSTLFAGRYVPKPGGKKRQQKPAPNVPTVFEGAEESGGQQPAGQAYDDQFGLSPQYQTTGMGLT